MTTMTTDPTPRTGELIRALPFWLCLLNLPLVALAAHAGGWTVALPALYAWGAFSVMDAVAGHDEANLDPATPDGALVWYRRVTLIWLPVQLVLIYGTLAYVTATGHLSAWEEVAVFAGVGVATGTIGITYAHELMHQKPRSERWLADLLLATVLYSHFRSEHLLVHHRHVATPRDPATARFGEAFWTFLPRVLVQSAVSAWRAERGMLARKGLSVHHRSNPFWRYAALQGAALMLALLIGGWWGLALFGVQAVVAVFQLELVNYVEHYGLVRRKLGEGRFEPTRPHHSWNAPHKASNWLLINLQRHSDHHYKPDRRFPLLQTYSPEEAPQMPHGYPFMTIAALVPQLWRWMMDRRVREWRARHYPEVDDWSGSGGVEYPVR
ncbi:alkane 1-monooxygenase [Jannaschia sp. LMIT008]|uniref:alkane 1-monooxygenase n=1 Tax=Jannaschia maritima TaxID=3032585 RepID=UPI0028115163|nr:alkane 1-monooxygenase [Jannaschia sp. LMIT008]